ncbi:MULTISPECIES: OB-fold-containig protein [Thermomonospora]|jgi:hypothetical protein|uniref:DUF1449 family protein n=1 Tax=Thermomonospora curvata (strain ATCC 19995 / DSM 43183 / JCM 3096 / KCTC 9072 / NBRC 15933 / NCIMB 10081 / Henssen B9) TaxID=471852 RepID=D1A6B0_THECD|nr:MULTISPECIES: OB-fold-containig protein [Thermomonospora]ACZ00209.1 conserved hypothetical protein [Thermomonospora curvata DSM 43183]PKK12019.1 MAG: hypothetical protein BUE48_023000 [Thermomonospora sp. CIF 1]
MGEFIETIFSFPTGLFTFALVVVGGYWLAMVLGAADLELLDGDDEAAGLSGFLGALRLGDVPVTVALSLLIAFSWFFSLVGAVMLDGLELSSPLTIALGLVVLALAVVLAWLATCLVVIPLRKALPRLRESSRHDFVGRVCVIRTSTVGPDFGQAEITAPDGSSAIIQVRQESEDPLAGPLTAGSTALIFDYDSKGEFFRVMPYDASMDPDRPLS